MISGRFPFVLVAVSCPPKNHTHTDTHTHIYILTIILHLLIIGQQLYHPRDGRQEGRPGVHCPHRLHARLGDGERVVHGLEELEDFLFEFACVFVCVCVCVRVSVGE